MKIIKSSVSVLNQSPGIEGMYKHIEFCGRIAYRTEDRITSDSYKKFIRMIYERGHWAVFNLGTVYLCFDSEKESEAYEKLKETIPWTKWENIGGVIYLTTNYRVICQLELSDFMEKYWVEPTEFHYHRVTSHWICNRGTSHQLVRHRILCPLQESQRYCNYSKDKFGNELSFIIPEWIYKVQEDIGNTIDSLTGESRKYLFDMDGVDLWNELCCLDRTVASRNNYWKLVEDEYLYETTTEEGQHLIPEEARGVLCNDQKTELCLCGYLKDWFYEPPVDSKEKAGFFFLRCASDAQPDIRVLSESLKLMFIEKGYDKWK